jgi:hypothetical protein
MTTYGACPDHAGQTFHPSTGACSCGAAHGGPTRVYSVIPPYDGPGPDDTPPARYVCKGCGAESPTGIGYVAGSGRVSFPDPRPGCPNPHLSADVPKGQSCSLVRVVTCDPCEPAGPGCRRRCVGHLASVCDAPAVHRVTVGHWQQQYACADPAHVVALVGDLSALAYDQVLGMPTVDR